MPPGLARDPVELAARTAAVALADRLNPVLTSLWESMATVRDQITTAIAMREQRPCALCLGEAIRWNTEHQAERQAAAEAALAAAVEEGKADGPEDPRAAGLDITPFLPEAPPVVYHYVAVLGGTELCEHHVAAAFAQPVAAQPAQQPARPLLTAAGGSVHAAAQAAYKGAPGMPGFAEAPSHFMRPGG